MNDIALPGCSPTPLASYLKALGVLRLLGSKYPDTRAFWHNETFVLRTGLDRAGIEGFFLDKYEPTPIMAPWNGGSGFYAKDNKQALQTIQNSNSPRLSAYRACLAAAQNALNGINRQAPPKGNAKTNLQIAIRSLLPDNLIEWFDAAVLLAGDTPDYPPLLGTGGNDGRLDFTNNFMQRVVDVFSDKTRSSRWLSMSLFGEVTPALVKSAIGQFSPGNAGGPNAGNGFEADAAINPWDFVLMIEGTLMFAAAAVRRNADEPAGVMSYPFTVHAVSAASGSLGEGDAAWPRARGELWMPLWKRPAGHVEIRALMAEGRVAWKRKPARDALDFVRAVQHLGGYRGVYAFQRFGILMRSGKAYLATPLTRVKVTDTPQSPWLDELDNRQWLDRFRRFATGEQTATRFRILRKRLEDMLFMLSGREPSRAQAQALLALLGEIQAALASSAKAREAVSPIPLLSERWVAAADDDSAAFRIAKALAGLRGISDQPLPLRAQLFPVQRKSDQWIAPDSNEKVRIHSGWKGALTDTLRALLERRLWLAEKLEMKDKPLDSPAGVTLDDMIVFLRDHTMDSRIAALLPGLCLCRIPQDPDRSAGDGALPAAFGLLKLALTPEQTLRSLGWLGEKEHLPIPAGMLAQLGAGNHENRAVKIAWRRLHASGLTPIFAIHALPELQGIDPRRAAAALLIPLRYGAVGQLTRSLLQKREAPAEIIP